MFDHLISAVGKKFFEVQAIPEFFIEESEKLVAHDDVARLVEDEEEGFFLAEKTVFHLDGFLERIRVQTTFFGEDDIGRALGGEIESGSILVGTRRIRPLVLVEAPREYYGHF